MKKQYLVFCYIILAFSSLGQVGKLKKADAYYEKLSYAYAVGLYEDLIGSEVATPVLFSKIASCYYYMGNMEKAETNFKSMIQTDAAVKEDYFLYAQALKQNGKYTESDVWMTKFNQLASSDHRGVSFISNSSYLQNIENQGIHFEIKNLNCNSAVADFGAYPSVDGNLLYFLSSRRKPIIIQYEWSWNQTQFLDVYKSTVAPNGEVENISLLNKRVNSRFHEGPLCFSPDGKRVYYTRNNISKGNQKKDQKGIQNLQLFRATVDSLGNWNDEEVLAFNSKEYSVGHPTISADGKTLYFVSDMPGGFGGADLYKADINGDGTFGKAENLGAKFNTEGQEMFPWINSKGELFFASNGHIGLGGLDVFIMSVSKNGSFDKLLNVGLPVNSQHDDFAFTMNSDNITGYFSSNRTGGKGDDDIYSYVLTKPFQQQLVVKSIVKDETTGEILPGATVKLVNSKGEVIASAITDEFGGVQFDVEPGEEYTIAVSGVDKYNVKQLAVSTKNLDSDITQVNGNVSLVKEASFSLYCLVTDAKSNLPLEDVKITITNSVTQNEFINRLTPKTGDVEKEIPDVAINDQLSYTIRLEKQGYLTKVVTFNYQLVQTGKINVHETLDLTMDKVDVGLDLTTIIDINPIYFDLGKFTIRADAAIELDKIVKVMNENPGMQIELGSHTDCRGSIASNEKLSDNRAKASADYIKQRISNPERINGKGFGESRLKVDCPCEGSVKSTCSEDEHQQNRRTEFVILKM
ncbi:MAG: OmpA family protein [Flavobacteriia bacterium]|jgi:outer membrane protein OmpA-like peptidoglycan-associated protein